jgi:hypothetical protein
LGEGLVDQAHQRQIERALTSGVVIKPRNG